MEKQCDDGMVAIGEVCYFVSSDIKTQGAARASCKAKNLTLITMEDPKENEAIKDYLSKWYSIHYFQKLAAI